MRIASVIAASTIGLSLGTGLSSACLAATITATADNRSGSISAFDGIGDPVQGGFSVTPGGNDFDPITFNQCVNDGGRSACMNVTSSYLNIGPGLVTEGMHANGQMQIVKPSGAGHAISDGFLSFAIQVSGVAPGANVPFDFTGSLTETGGAVANGIISLTGPGVSLSFSTTGTWDQNVNLVNGTYTLTVDANLIATSSAAANASIAFDVTLAEIPPTCGPTGGSCFSTHAGGCDDVECCSSVCAADPFCCSNFWDSQCVIEAADVCPQRFLTDRVINPLNGRRYRLMSPRPWSDSVTFLSTDGLAPARIANAADNDWLTRNMAKNLPGLNAPTSRIGLNDIASEGTYTWPGVAPTYYNWAPGEPNNFNNEDNTEIVGATGLWNDVSTSMLVQTIGDAYFANCGQGGNCFQTHGPACSDESCCNEVCFADPFCCQNSWDAQCVSEAQTWCGATTIGAPIPNPATRHKYVLLSGGTWTQAEKIAHSLGGHLAVINSAAENEWIRLNTIAIPGNPQQLYIGLHDQAVEGKFQWVNHEPVSYTNWGAGEPNNSNDEDFTLMNSNGTWNDLDSTFVVAAIVEIPCAGDLDGDGLVGGADLAVLLGSWGSAASAADLNNDSKVDAADLGVLLGGWGPCASSNACVAHSGGGSDQPGCTKCVCDLDPFCCNSQWDGLCVEEAGNQCKNACQCGG